jgi:hypothetical protein
MPYGDIGEETWLEVQEPDNRRPLAQRVHRCRGLVVRLHTNEDERGSAIKNLVTEER